MWRLAIPAFLAFGELCGFANSAMASIWPLAAFLAIVVLLFGHGRAIRGWKFAFVFMLGFALAMHSACVRGRVLREASEPGRPLKAGLVVEGVPLDGVGGSRWTSFDSTFKGVDVRVIFKLEDGVEPPRVGETWRCSGWLERKSPSDYRRRRLWIKGSGTFAVRDESAGRSVMLAFFDSARRDMSRRLGIGLDGTEYSGFADINRAILLGERCRLPHEIRETFVDAGTLHIFAISGLHVAIIAKVLVALLVMMMVPFRVVGVVAIPVLWFYVCMVGAGPSAVRAAAMASLCMLAPLGMKRPDGISAWTATFVTFHVLWPESLVNVASLLSFTVMLGMLIFAEWAKSFRSRIVEVVGVTVAAWAAGAPIVAHVFGRITPGGVLANLILVPAAEFSVGAGLLGAAISHVSSTLAAHFNFAAALVAKAMVGVSWAVAHIPGATVQTSPWTLWDCVAWYSVLGLSMWLVRSIALRRRQTL
jgi:ComEC/Rec2-related protein